MKPKWKLVENYSITNYKCGFFAGDKVRLKHDIRIRDHTGKFTGEIHPTGEIWTVLTSAKEDPVLWLRQANGVRCTWSDDESALETFEKISPKL